MGYETEEALRRRVAELEADNYSLGAELQSTAAHLSLLEVVHADARARIVALETALADAHRRWRVA